MKRPRRLWDQYEGKALAELHRGSGWLLQPHPCDLEPPWDDFDRNSVNVWDCVFNDWEGPWDGRLFGFGDRPLHRADEPLILPSDVASIDPNVVLDLVPIVVEQFPDDEATIPKAEQLILSIGSLHRPFAFEVLGLGPQPSCGGLETFPELIAARWGKTRPSSWIDPLIRVQFVTHRADADGLYQQLLAHYPNSAVVRGEVLDFPSDYLPGQDMLHGHGYGASLQLAYGHLWPLKMFSRLEPDPLGVAVAAMEHLHAYEWAQVQVLFQPTRYPWAESAQQAATDPYQPGQYLFNDVTQKLFREKFASPLFAVSIRITALRQQTYRSLLGWAEQFAAPPQRLAACADENQGDLSWSLMARCSFRPGLLLNAQELAGFVHLPATSLASERLRRVQSRTRPAVATVVEAGSVILGDNVHRGQRNVARISASLRPRHCYIAGASGTGKSTLLLNMIMQDIAAGRGVGVFDPHGDLVNAVRCRIPEHRIDDVIYFNPADEDYPFALNILEATDSAERERIVNETLMALERYFPTSWGPRLERILSFTLYTCLAAIPGATLADIEQMLTDPVFRASVVDRTTDARLVRFWHNEFPNFPKNACDPVLNKLSVFLMSSTVRNIICQRRSAVNFDSLINGDKILLANLSTGLLTEKVAGMFGSFLVTKIVNAAFRRANVPIEQRRPWYLYVDEFQAFMNLSIGFERILAEARKYNLVLAGLANQYVGQLSPAVRQAIFGNVGVMIIFRVGVDDANTVAREMGVFTAEEILSLELGQAIARTGGSATAFNIHTYPDPPLPPTDPSPQIIDLTRDRYARPRAEVEAELNFGQEQAAEPISPPESSGRRQRSNIKKHRQANQPPSPADDVSDPSEDDLVD